MSLYPGDSELEKAVAASDEFQIATLLRLRMYDRWANNDVDGAISDLRAAAKHYGAASKKVNQFVILYSVIPILIGYKRIAEAESFLAEAETLLDQIDPAEFPPLAEQTLTQLDEHESRVVYATDPTKTPDEFCREGLNICRLLIQNQR